MRPAQRRTKRFRDWNKFNRKPHKPLDCDVLIRKLRWAFHRAKCEGKMK